MRREKKKVEKYEKIDANSNFSGMIFVRKT